MLFEKENNSWTAGDSGLIMVLKDDFYQESLELLAQDIDKSSGQVRVAYLPEENLDLFDAQQHIVIQDAHSLDDNGFSLYGENLLETMFMEPDITITESLDNPKSRYGTKNSGILYAAKENVNKNVYRALDIMVSYSAIGTPFAVSSPGHSIERGIVNFYNALTESGRLFFPESLTHIYAYGERWKTNKKSTLQTLNEDAVFL